MKTTLKLLAVLALALTSFTQPATSARANVIRWKGQGASVQFSSVDASGCISTFVFVQANEQLLRNPPNQNDTISAVSVTMYQNDDCQGIELLFADGLAELTDSAFKVRGAESADLASTTVSLYDYYTGTNFDVDVNMTWTGLSFRRHETSMFAFNFPSCRMTSRFDHDFRFAEVSGTVTIAGATLTPNTDVFATIFSEKQGDLQRSCTF